MAADRRLILHVLPVDLPRGAQALARAVCDQLDGRPDRHEAVTLFRSPSGILQPEHRLDAADGRLRAAGLSPAAAWRFRRLIRRLRPDAVVCHGGEPLKYLPFAGLGRTPVVYYRVGTANEHLAAGWHRALYRRLVGRCTVVAISAGAADEAAALFDLDRSAIEIIHNMRDPERFRPRESAVPSADDDLVALFVGRVSREKGADRFVDVIGRLRGEGLAIRGVMAGEGPLADDLPARAAEAGVAMVGHRDDIPGLMADADIFVFPGVDREGMPGVLVEAGLCGLACVSADLPGVPEVIEDGLTGVVFPPGDDEALAAGVRRVATDAAARAAMGAAARARCVAAFSNEAVGERWQVLLGRLLGR